MSGETRYSYGREKLWQAVDCLATSSGTIQQRLESAAMFLIRLNPGDQSLPSELHGEFESIYHDLTKTTAQGSEGRIQATLQLMSDEEGSKLASRIFSLYTKLRGGL
jgi:hypothetical protein